MDVLITNLLRIPPTANEGERLTAPWVSKAASPQHGISYSMPLPSTEPIIDLNLLISSDVARTGPMIRIQTLLYSIALAQRTLEKSTIHHWVKGCHPPLG